MQIKLMAPALPVTDFSINAATVIVGGVTIDTSARQQDTATNIEIRNNGGTIAEGGSGAYVAQIDIPARRYTSVQVPAQGSAAPTTTQQAVPLDPNAVVVTLWPTV